MWSELIGRADYWLSATLFLIGLYGMLVHPNLVKKLMAMNIMQVAVIVFYITVAFKSNATPPISIDNEYSPTAREYINPLPHTLMLTAIVVSISTTGVALSLIIRIHRRYSTLNEIELIAKLRQ